MKFLTGVLSEDTIKELNQKLGDDLLKQVDEKLGDFKVDKLITSIKERSPVINHFLFVFSIKPPI